MNGEYNGKVSLKNSKRLLKICKIRQGVTFLPHPVYVSHYSRHNTMQIRGETRMPYAVGITSKMTARCAPYKQACKNSLGILISPTPTLPFLQIFNGLLFGWTLWMHLQNLKYVPSPMLEIIAIEVLGGGCQKISDRPLLCPHSLFPKKLLSAFHTDYSSMCTSLVLQQFSIGVLGGGCEPPI